MSVHLLGVVFSCSVSKSLIVMLWAECCNWKRKSQLLASSHPEKGNGICRKPPSPHLKLQRSIQRERAALHTWPCAPGGGGTAGEKGVVQQNGRAPGLRPVPGTGHRFVASHKEESKNKPWQSERRFIQGDPHSSAGHLGKWEAPGYRVTSFHCCHCSVSKLWLPLCDPMDCSMPGSPVLHCLTEFAQTHAHWLGDAI